MYKTNKTYNLRVNNLNASSHKKKINIDWGQNFTK